MPQFVSNSFLLTYSVLSAAFISHAFFCYLVWLPVNEFSLGQKADDVFVFISSYSLLCNFRGSPGKMCMKMCQHNSMILIFGDFSCVL